MLGGLNMDILLIFPGFILACLVVLLYEYKIRLLRKQRNNVHFYVARDSNGSLWLYIGKPVRGDTVFSSANSRKTLFLTSHNNFKRFGLNENDYANLKWEDEPVEVFLNMEN